MAGSALLALGGATGVGLAQDDGGTGGPVTGDSADAEILNYALALEQLQSALYEEGLERFSRRNFRNVGPLRRLPFGVGQGSIVYDSVQTIAEQEAAHVEALEETIEERGVTPTSPASYDFGFESANQMVADAQVVENAAVAAYAGVAPWLDDADLLGVALSMHSVEARHAAVLNFLAGDSPFPAAFDPTLPPADAFDVLGEYFATAPAVLDDGTNESGN